MQVGSINDALLHAFQHVDFGTLRADTLDDCAFVGGDDIGGNVIAQQIITTDFQDDDVRPGRHPAGGVRFRSPSYLKRSVLLGCKKGSVCITDLRPTPMDTDHVKCASDH
jgi:hypothetical protein